MSTVATDDHDYRAAIAVPIARSDDDGRFAITVDDAADKWLLIGGERFAVHRRELPLATATLDIGPIALAPGFAATGRVRGGNGDRLAGAYVVGTDLLAERSRLRIGAHHLAMPPATEAVVGRDGIFALPGMLQCAGRIVVRCAGYYDATVRPVAMGVPLDVTLRPAPNVRGRVIDAQGQPVADAEVFGTHVLCRSAADGTFRCSPRNPTVRALSASVERDGQPLTGHAAIPLGDDVAIEIVVDGNGPDRNVEVRARAADGSWLKAFDAYVSCQPSRPARPLSDAELLPRANRKRGGHATADDGLARLAIDRSGNEVIVLVRAPGHGWGRLRLDYSKLPSSPIVVTLPEPCAIGGRLVDVDSGEPIADAMILPIRDLTDRLRQRLVTGMADVADICAGPDAVRTDDDGRWRLEGLPAGKAELLVCLDGHVVGGLDDIELVAGQTHADLTIERPSRRTLAGNVIGVCPPGTQLRLHWDRPDRWSSRWQPRLDGALEVSGDQPFAFEHVLPLPHRIELVMPPTPRNGVRCKVLDGEWNADRKPEQPVVVAAVALVEASGRVAGPIPWHRLAVHAQGADTYARQRPAAYGQVAVLDSERRYRLRLPAGDWALSLVDTLTGVVLERRDVAAADLRTPARWSGAAHAVNVALHERTQRLHHVSIRHEPAPEDQPPQRGGIVLASFTPLRHGSMSALSDERLVVFVPRESGHIKVWCGRGQASANLRGRKTFDLAFDVDDYDVTLREP